MEAEAMQLSGVDCSFPRSRHPGARGLNALPIRLHSNDPNLVVICARKKSRSMETLSALA